MRGGIVGERCSLQQLGAWQPRAGAGIVARVSRLGIFLTAYVTLAALALAAAHLGLEQSPWVHPSPWLTLGIGARHFYSGLMGLALGGVMVLLTRLSVERFTWAKRLHADLRPYIQGIDSLGILLLAVASSVAEELVFRGVLQNWLGLIPQAIVFGFVHQLPGQSRWVWAFWAGLVGVVLGAVFQLTGSLVGPILAHGVVNGMNLHYLKGFNPAPPKRQLGGILSEFNERRR